MPYSPRSSQLLAAAVLLATPVALAGVPDGSGPVHELAPAFLPAEAAAPSLPPPLSRDVPEAFRAGQNLHVLGQVAAARIAAADAEATVCPTCPEGKRQRTGFVRTLDQPINQIGTIETPLLQNRSMWTFAVRSPGAQAVRLRFEELDLRGAAMIVWSEGADGPIVRGAYRGRGPDDDGELWTASVPGETIHVEIVGREAPNFTLREIVHFDRDASNPVERDDGDGGINGNGVFSCHNDAMCYVDPDDDVARRATGQMNFVSGGNSYVCTGTLLNDSDGDTSAPYFLTANHCLSTETEANSLEVVWLWQKSACNGTLPDYNTLPRSTGADILATTSVDDGNDMTFMRLDGLLPGGLAFAGWTTAHPSTGRSFHHPSGSWKRGTTFDAVGICLYCICLDSSDFDYYKMTDGLVEGGSSGGGIFNSAGQLFGQLYGRCGDAISPDDMSCSNIDDFAAMYGEFEETYPEIDFWLSTLGGTIWVNAAQPNFPPQNGSSVLPFDLISEGYAAAFDGAQIKVIGGNYPGAITMTKVLTITAPSGVAVIGQ